jgi:uracil-DNA glycosylase
MALRDDIRVCRFCADRFCDRLRGWIGLSAAEFHDRSRVAVAPMLFCFPSDAARWADLPPSAVSGVTRRYLGLSSVTAAVADWRGPAARGVFPLPHPAGRNTGWL